MMIDSPRECRCCRIPIGPGKLACRQHWFMLPIELRRAITHTYLAHKMRAYVENVTEAERIWKEQGVWRGAAP